MKYHLQITSPEGAVSDYMPLKASDEANAKRFAVTTAAAFENTCVKLYVETDLAWLTCVYEINSPTPSYSVVIKVPDNSLATGSLMKVGNELQKQSTAFNIAKTIMAIPDTIIAECLIYRHFGLETTQIKSFKKEDI